VAQNLKNRAFGALIPGHPTFEMSSSVLGSIPQRLAGIVRLATAYLAFFRAGCAGPSGVSVMFLNWMGVPSDCKAIAPLVTLAPVGTFGGF